MSFDVFPVAMLILAFVLANYGGRFYRVRLNEKAVVSHRYQLSGEYTVGYWKEPKVRKVSDADLQCRLESILVEFAREVESYSMYRYGGFMTYRNGRRESQMTTSDVAGRLVAEVKEARRLTK